MFSVYLAKKLHKAEWNCRELKELVQKARMSYLRYGPVPLIDKYDGKSQVYAVSVEYKERLRGNNRQAIEWFSIRFTPADGRPKYHEDFLLSVTFNQSLHLLLKRIFPRQEAKNFVSISRICRIQPQDQNGKTMPHGNRYTLACFALANLCFLSDKTATKNLKFISGLFRPELVEKKFSVKIKNRTLPRYNTAENLFPNAGFSPKLKRNLYIYTYPLYFLKFESLYGQLRQLANSGHLTKRTLKEYLGLESLEDIKKLHARGHLLGMVLSAKGKIKHSKLTGSELRKILDATVGDGPELKIMELSEWKKDMEVINQNLKTVVNAHD